MGIETLILQRHKGMKLSSEQSELQILSESMQCQNQDCIKESFLSAKNENLRHNSFLLYRLAEIVRENFDDIHIEQKFTATDSRILAGITIDWREIKDWKLFKTNSEPQLKKMIVQKQKVDPERPNIHIQTYSTHPFIDIYSTKCDKGMAYDQIISMITTSKKRQLNIIYLGDSENDNPAFRKATIPIGIQSDSRLKPNLDCSYYLHISKLSIFLKSLIANNLEFSQNLITI
ncbi:MAG TPA: HAD hydrolase family protein [Nitrososphaeraceae archaeon]|jgi:hydroxymethylpyrimidine pyrophosphatase-like HAD family hydrolase